MILELEIDLSKNELTQNETCEKLRKTEEGLRLNLCLSTFETNVMT